MNIHQIFSHIKTVNLRSLKQAKAVSKCLLEMPPYDVNIRNKHSRHFTGSWYPIGIWMKWIPPYEMHKKECVEFLSICNDEQLLRKLRQKFL